MKIRSKKAYLIPAIPLLWLLVFLLVPYLIVFKLSFSTKIQSLPPYEPSFSLVEESTLNDGASLEEVIQESVSGVKDQIVSGAYLEKLKKFTIRNFTFLASDSLYSSAYLNSLINAGLGTLFALLIGFPMAYAISRTRVETQSILILLIAIPFWTSFLIRVYALLSFVGDRGYINNLLTKLGLISSPIPFYDSGASVIIGIVYTYLPFMILPLYATLQKLDTTLDEAAADLGCTRFQVFWRVTVPLSLPGIVAGSSLVFIPAIGEYVIPYLLGPDNKIMIGKVLYTEFFSNADWPVASALAIVLLTVLIIPILIFQHYQQRLDVRLS